MKNNFQELVTTAADLLIELRALESQTKLSASAFLAEAMLTAGCTRNSADLPAEAVQDHAYELLGTPAERRSRTLRQVVWRAPANVTAPETG